MIDAAKPGAAQPSDPSRFKLLLLFVGVLAFLLREYFVLAGIVDHPIAGDVRDYVFYAWNLVDHGVYSGALPSAQVPAPDAFRSPGQPWLIALCMSVFPQGSDWSQLRGWYPLALQLQVLLGASTVVLTGLVARAFLPSHWAVLSALLLAFWPHHVAATGALLSEVSFGFALMLALYLATRGWRSQRKAWWIACGAAFGFAWLVNPLIALFPPLLCGVLAMKHRTRDAAWLLGVFLIPVLALGIRNAAMPEPVQDKPGRAVVNLVQGAWPPYHAAYVFTLSRNSPWGKRVLADINRETELLHTDPAAGGSAILLRFGDDPLVYTRWYLWEKPQLLWDWDIRIGAGGFYFLQVRESPYNKNPILRASAQALRFANPLLTAMCLVAALALGLLAWRGKGGESVATVGMLALYLTLVHVVFQAEPRYATAYRGIEAVLVVALLSWATHRLLRGRRDAQAASTTANDS